MIYLTIFFSIVALLGLLALCQQNFRDAEINQLLMLAVFVIIGFMLIIFAGFRDSTVDRDYRVYVDRFQCITQSAVEAGDIACEVEPTFIVMAKMAAFFGWGTAAIVLAYAIIGVSLKMTVLYRAPHPLMSCVMYLCPWFMLHEMTQIRVGVACALGLMSLLALSRGIRWAYLLAIASGALFHYSALVYLLLPLMGMQRHRPAIGVTILAVCIGASLIDIATVIPALTPLVEGSRYEAYIQLPDAMELSERFGPFKLLAVAIYLAAAMLQNKLQDPVQKRLFMLCLNSVLLGNCFFYLFYSFPNVSLRMWELFLVPDILLVPMMASMVRPRFVGWAAVMSIPLLYLYFYLTQTDVFASYATSL